MASKRGENRPTPPSPPLHLWDPGGCCFCFCADRSPNRPFSEGRGSIERCFAVVVGPPVPGPACSGCRILARTSTPKTVGPGSGVIQRYPNPPSKSNPWPTDTRSHLPGPRLSGTSSRPSCSALNETARPLANLQRCWTKSIRTPRGFQQTQVIGCPWLELYQRRPQTEQCSKMRSPNNMASSIS